MFTADALGVWGKFPLLNLYCDCSVITFTWGCVVYIGPVNKKLAQQQIMLMNPIDYIASSCFLKVKIL